MSFMWHKADTRHITRTCKAAHLCLFGIMHRYVLMLKAGLKARSSQDINDFDDLHRKQSDVCMLQLFESFMESAPQLVLQLYIMLAHRQYHIWTAITAFSSMVSLGWGITAYTKTMRNRRFNKHKMSIPGLILQTIWRIGLIGSRVAALAVGATVLNHWFLLIMGIHLIIMFIWVMRQKANIGKTKWEETVFNFIMAVICCFCFFNLKEGKSRWRMLIFYTITLTENSIFVLYYFFVSSHEMWMKITALSLVFGGMTIGLTCLAVYYCFFHPNGPRALKSWFAVKEDPEIGSSPSKDIDGFSPDSNGNRSSPLRTSMGRNIKYLYQRTNQTSNSVLSAPGVSLESSPTSSKDEPSPAPNTYQPIRPSEMMCSVQDLLANVSCTSQLQIEAEINEDQERKSPVPGQKQEEGHEASPSSLERSVTRELNIRLSSSEFRNYGLLSSPIEEEKESSTTVSSSHVSEQFINCKTQTESVHSSPNSIGVPQTSKSSLTSLRSGSLSVSQRSGTSILRTSVTGQEPASSESDLRHLSIPHVTTSASNLTTKSHFIALEENRIEPIRPAPTVDLAVLERLHSIDIDSSMANLKNENDYENVFEGKIQRENLPPKPANLLAQNLDETQTTESSIPHDYENICAVNINREMWGVRHWKTYSDIEDKDRIHDNSTNKERLRMLDSTLVSSIYSDYSTLMGVQGLRSSIAEESESILSRSLPDLSALRLETCFEEPEEEDGKEANEAHDSPKKDEEVCNEVKDDIRLMTMLNQLRANKQMNKSSSVDNIPNYETIWVGDVEKPENTYSSSQMSSLNSRSSLVVTIGDVRAKESLCNLYYSTMSDLSFRYYSERMRRNNSVSSLNASKRSTVPREPTREMMRAISVPDNKTLLEVSQLLDEQRKQQEEEEKTQKDNNEGPVAATPCKTQTLRFGPGSTPVRSDPSNNRPRRKFSMLRERFENNNWTPLRSPMRRRPSTQRRDSFQDRTAKALQAGMKVFRRPRVHVITPKHEEKIDTPRLKSPFKGRNTTPFRTPAIKLMADPSVTEPAAKTRLLDNEMMKSAIKTPQVKVPTEHMLSKKTPKTSTPDNKQHLIEKTHVAIDAKRVRNLTEGPKTSTPEGNKALPHISILSAVSSVVPSPESALKFNISDQQQRIPLSETTHQNRVSTKSLAMPVIKETEFNPAFLLPKPFYGALRPGVRATGVSHPLLLQGDENIQEALRITSSGLSSARSIQTLPSKQVPSWEGCSSRLPHAQAMFSGSLGLPPMQQEAACTAVISVSEKSENLQGQQNVSVSHIVLSSPKSPNFNSQKSTLSPNSKIFSRRI